MADEQHRAALKSWRVPGSPQNRWRLGGCKRELFTSMALCMPNLTQADLSPATQEMTAAQF